MRISCCSAFPRCHRVSFWRWTRFWTSFQFQRPLNTPKPCLCQNCPTRARLWHIRFSFARDKDVGFRGLAGRGRKNERQKRVQRQKLVLSLTCDNLETLLNWNIRAHGPIIHFSTFIRRILTDLSTFLKKWTLSVFSAENVPEDFEIERAVVGW